MGPDHEAVRREVEDQAGPDREQLRQQQHVDHAQHGVDHQRLGHPQDHPGGADEEQRVAHGQPGGTEREQAVGDEAAGHAGTGGHEVGGHEPELVAQQQEEREVEQRVDDAHRGEPQRDGPSHRARRSSGVTAARSTPRAERATE
jgi:hypothetical protein